MVPLIEFTRRTPSAVGLGSGGSVALLKTGAEADGVIVRLVSEAEVVLLGVIDGAASEVPELFDNEIHSFIPIICLSPRVDIKRDWNRDCNGDD